ncbi:MAG: putative dual-specificity RNA methyltransferase RlmN [Candidatus Shapirobacteria bacterium GW2011_GWE1_38_10]|uniref:Putative dual-specificity RNA methyltransferase RlmN n=1 Tax=Candidatus Shapirobacteria bacterium GW2011_GWE1_38_10 TaxID=1618488 RepID=A0A0G0IFF2_9BACT|nr:MAG: putative dual-specificity RNA methyltransferase RlmN [Candidatus Shapirobacteria bacterium GW2011_GWF2_37_20]KKQ49705.1 MAG: putative dual-specificity RNA methyltransferase RlmN [Candidatus Shapirobacteria bacterium GW2011_GWE1_38_10]KKQ64414.1 MAG: putative dual-specificity RNA methyltransferase RlmN [Candidatus Shapirobacteria bacterium GW2011_GWF1_38_23]
MDIIAVDNYLNSLNLPSFRHRQIKKNYYSGRFQSFLEMTDLPKDLRTFLQDKFPLLSVSEINLQTGTGTQKAALQLSDGLAIESVIMEYDQWITACVSSQVGCPLNCKFCATGKMGFKRNLTAAEIVDQIIYWNSKISPKYVGRIVFMGMGEPFLNWDNLLAALKIIKEDLNIGSRKISISTAGIVPRIYDFASLDTEINLAISLHAPNQLSRQDLMPIAKLYPLDELIKSLNYYTSHTRRQIFLEYALIKDVNDSSSHLSELIALLKSNDLFYLNLIPLNPVKGGSLPSSKMKVFTQALTKAHVNFSLRQTFGQSINSACGQLITGI